MSIHRVQLSFERDFTMVPNAWLRDERLTLRARGLLAQLMSHKVGWEITIESLYKCNPEGRDAIRRAIKELEDHGYLSRSQGWAEGHKFGPMDYTITDPTTAPQGPVTPHVTPAPLAGAPVTENPTTENPTSGNPPTKKTIPIEDHLKNSPAADAAPGYTDEFETFWKVYPRKRDKKIAFKAWKAAMRRTTPEVATAAAQTYARACKAKRTEEQYIKHGATWLNGDGWNDYPAPTTIRMNSGRTVPEWSKAECDSILGGPDYWSCPKPPDGLDLAEERAWKQARTAEHLNERRQKAWEVMNSDSSAA